MEHIKIKEIQISNLFGELNYDIKIPSENPIAIITAPNGRGKTTLLNLCSFVFKPSFQLFSAIRSVPFDTFRCILSNGKTVELKKVNLDLADLVKFVRSMRPAVVREQMPSRIRALFDDGDFTFTIFNGEKQYSSPIVFSHAMIEASNMDPMEYLDDEDENLSMRSRRSTQSTFVYVCKEMTSVLRDCFCNIPVNFIEADRIQPVTVMPSRYRDYDEPRQESPLDLASKKIGELITKATDNYFDAVSQAKDKLPKMFLEDEGGDLSDEEFMGGWYDYRKELTQFQDIGLITPTEDFIQGKDIPSVYPQKGKFLSTYLWAFKETTKPLREIYERLNLFKSILDERNAITGKKVTFDREGVKLAAGEREIKLSTLSSGEKHDFIMFYNLIMGGESNGLVLIDEPEISLHIEWQETYLDKLIAICKMNNLQAIVATHSPNIVSSHYDFLVDKGERNG